MGKSVPTPLTDRGESGTIKDKAVALREQHFGMKAITEINAVR